MDNSKRQEPEIITEYTTVVRALQHAPNNKKLISHIKWKLYRNRPKYILKNAAYNAAITAVGVISPVNAWMLKKYLKP